MQSNKIKGEQLTRDAFVISGAARGTVAAIGIAAFIVASVTSGGTIPVVLSVAAATISLGGTLAGYYRARQSYNVKKAVAEELAKDAAEKFDETLTTELQKPAKTNMPTTPQPKPTSSPSLIKQPSTTSNPTASSKAFSFKSTLDTKNKNIAFLKNHIPLEQLDSILSPTPKYAPKEQRPSTAKNINFNNPQPHGISLSGNQITISPCFNSSLSLEKNLTQAIQNINDLIIKNPNPSSIRLCEYSKENSKEAAILFHALNYIIKNNNKNYGSISVDDKTLSLIKDLSSNKPSLL